MDNIKDILDELNREDNLRVLCDVACEGKYVTYQGVRSINMSSNDYLGLGADISLQGEFFDGIADCRRFLMSNSASRLMTGNSPDFKDIESSIASLYPDGKSCLVFGAGYVANVGILPAMTSRDDVILADKLVHASIIDGLRLCKCPWHRFAHNDMEHLESLVKKARQETSGDIWVVTESIFSMDGDRAPVELLVALKHKYGLRLYVDEAHAFGVEGPAGAGCAASLGLVQEIDIIVGTLGKALASYGAFAVVDTQVRELLVNRMRPLIFSTALPPINLMWTKFLVDRLPQFDDRRTHLRLLIDKMSGGNTQATHISPIMTYGNAEALALTKMLRDHGFWTTAIRYPTVPKGQARVRISLSAALDVVDIDKFIDICKVIG